jgi:NAD(P)H-dependent FMN reductase
MINVIKSQIKSQIKSLQQSRTGDLAGVRLGGVVNVLGVASSMREDFHSTRALQMVLEEAKKYGSESHLLELRKINLPLYDPGGFGSDEPSSNKNNICNDDLERITTAIKWVDVFALASPDYHGSMSGGMKNLLDYFWEEFAGKTFGYIVASHEKGLTVADQMRTAIRQCYGWSMPCGISVNGEKDFDSKGNLANSALAQRIKMLARDLVTYGGIIRGQFIQDIADQELSDTFASHYREYYNQVS